MESTNEIEIDHVNSHEFEFENFTICHENGIWWIDFGGDDEESILIIEAPDEGIYFEEDETLLEVGITEEIFRRVKEVVDAKAI